MQNIQIAPRFTSGNDLVTGLIIKHQDATIKVEMNTVIKGSVYPIVEKCLCEKA